MMCIATQKSSTAAQRSKRILEKEGIDCSIVSLDASLTQRGCAWGIYFYADSAESARRLLRSRRIQFGELIAR